MRVERPQDRRFTLALAALLVAGAAVVGAAVARGRGALAGAVLGLAAAAALRRHRDARALRRQRILVAPFPDRWRRFLEDRCDPYARLPHALRDRFEADLRLVLAEKRITGVDVEATDELRLLAAASAITVSLGWPDYEWDQLTEVLLYKQDFDRDYGYESAELAGQAHPWGTVILSAPALRESYEDPDDAYNVGIHEFAHLLDVDQTHFEGIPVGLDPARAREWVSITEDEMSRLRRGRSVIDDYGADDPVEFLAVAVEAFFEIPLLLRRRHRELYAILSEYFAQDPAAWDEERGIRYE